jgi:hypothetical protein
VLGKSPKLPPQLHKLLIFKDGAGNENRTRIASLEGWSFTIKLCPHLKGIRAEILTRSCRSASRFFPAGPPANPVASGEADFPLVPCISIR